MHGTDLEPFPATACESNPFLLLLLSQVRPFPNALRDVFDLFQQFLGCHRFGNVAVRSESLRQRLAIVQSDGRKHQKRNRVVGTPKTVQNLKTILAGKYDIDDDKIRPTHAKGGMSLATVFGHLNAIAVLLQQGLQRVGRRTIVFHQQDVVSQCSGRHAFDVTEQHDPNSQEAWCLKAAGSPEEACQNPGRTPLITGLFDPPFAMQIAKIPLILTIGESEARKNLKASLKRQSVESLEVDGMC